MESNLPPYENNTILARVVNVTEVVAIDMGHTLCCQEFLNFVYSLI